MPIITLTTDFGTKDYFTAAVKGSIYSDLGENANIVDITHSIQPFHINQGAYVLKNAYPHFPEGTIHIIGIDSELDEGHAHIAAQIRGHYFIGADNGIISILTNEVKADKMVQLNINSTTDCDTFSTKDIFVKAASHLARGGTMEVIGKPITQLKEVKGLNPTVTDNKYIKGSVIYIDHFGNLITNITKKQYREVGKTRDFEILLPRNYRINKLNRTYNETKKEGEKLALFNSAGHLEIAIYKSDGYNIGGAASLLGIKVQDPITIEFKS